MTDLFDRNHLDGLAREKSVRGEVVRLAMQRLQECDPADEQTVLEALQLLLDCFDASGEGQK